MNYAYPGSIPVTARSVKRKALTPTRLRGRLAHLTPPPG
jgi:hypothetical protein